MDNYLNNKELFIQRWNAFINKWFRLDDSYKQYLIADYLKATLSLDFPDYEEISWLAKMATKNMAVFMNDAFRILGLPQYQISDIDSLNDITRIYNNTTWPSDKIYVPNKVGVFPLNVQLTNYLNNIKADLERFIYLLPVNNNAKYIGKIFCLNLQPKSSLSSPGGFCVCDCIFINDKYSNNKELFTGILIHEIFGHHIQQRSRMQRLPFFDGLFYEEFIAELSMIWMFQYTELLNIFGVSDRNSIIQFHINRIKAIGVYNNYYKDIAAFLDNIGYISVANPESFDKIKNKLYELSDLVDSCKFILPFQKR